MASPPARRTMRGLARPHLAARSAHAPRFGGAAARPLDRMPAPPSPSQPHRGYAARVARRRRWQRRGARLAAAVLLLSLAVILLLFAQRLQQRDHLSILAPATTPGDTQGPDRWHDLKQQNADTIAWLTVEGTGIDTPVVQPREPRPADWYLAHNFFGAPDRAGCPYLDTRATISSPHLLIYGHHIAGTREQFSELAGVWRQASFDTLGCARLWCPGRMKATRWEPLAALRVPASDQRLQRFAFPDEQALRTWLLEVVRTASAGAVDPAALLVRTERVLTLVTCSAWLPRQPWRTLVLFVATEAPP